MKKPKKQFSLKIRIFVFFFGILLLMLCTYIFAISRFITRFTERQLNSDYEAILTETSDTIETLLWNLTLTSEQLLSNETIRTCILGYQNTDNPYVKLENWSCISETILSLTMDNTDIALTYIYDPSTEEYIYSTLPADAENEEIPVIYENSAFCFQGPCNSQSKFIGNPVLILNRTEILESENPILLSVESGYYSLDGPLEQAARKSAYIAITNYLGELIYHTFPETIDASEILTRISDGSDPEYRFFSDTSSQGWSVHVVIPSSIYTRDYQSAIRDFAVCSILIALLVACFAMYFWKSIYQPLQLFDRQFDILLSDDIPEEQMHSSIPEYDRLLKRIVVLQAQIREMIGRIIEQEKLNTKIQLEKLRAQINPHFLMNTLNTIHWMSLMNGQKDIDRITQSLSHLLSYNLDKESYITSLKLKFSSLYHLLLSLENVWNTSYSELTGESISLPESFHHWSEVEDWLMEVYEKTNLFSSSSRYSSEVTRSVLIVKKRVDTEYTSSFDTTEVARTAGMSYGYFSRCFHDIVGMPFSEYCTLVRITKAKELLQNTGNSIQQIAFDVGYNDEKYFSRLFKKHTGQSPSEFRRQA